MIRFFRLLFALALPLSGATAYAQTPSSDNRELVFLVQLDPLNSLTAQNAYVSNFNVNAVYLRIEALDSLRRLEKLSPTTEAALKSECFGADLKIIFKHATYVIGTDCGSVVKYKNVHPFVATSKRLPCEFEMTATLQSYFKSLRDRHFDPYENQFFDLATLAKVKPESLMRAEDLARMGTLDKELASVKVDMEPIKLSKPGFRTEKEDKTKTAAAKKTKATPKPVETVVKESAQPVAEIKQPEKKVVKIEEPVAVVSQPAKPEPVKPVVVEKPKPEPVKPVVVEKPKSEPVKPVVVEKPKPEPVKPVVVETPKPEPVKPVAVETPKPKPIEPVASVEEPKKPAPVAQPAQPEKKVEPVPVEEPIELDVNDLKDDDDLEDATPKMEMVDPKLVLPLEDALSDDFTNPELDEEDDAEDVGDDDFIDEGADDEESDDFDDSDF